MKIQQNIKNPVLQVTLLTGVLLIFITATDPYALPLPLLMVPFLLLCVLIYRSVGLILRPLIRSKKRTTYIASVMTSVCMLVILLQTIRQLSLKDFLILGALFVGLTFYMRRIDL